MSGKDDFLEKSDEAIDKFEEGELDAKLDVEDEIERDAKRNSMPWGYYREREEETEEGGVETEGEADGNFSDEVEGRLDREEPVTVEEKYQDLLEWAEKLTAEQSAPYEKFVWNKQAKRLLKRLELTQGNLISVVGPQGSGKTSLKEALWVKLTNRSDEKVLSLKWRTGEPIERAIMMDEGWGMGNIKYAPDKLIHAIIVRFVHNLGAHNPSPKHNIGKLQSKLGSSKKAYAVARYYEDDSGPGAEVKDSIPKIVSYLGRKKMDELLREHFQEAIERGTETLLIDFPDYDRSARGKMRSDLRNFQEWWEETIEPDRYSGGYEQEANIVIFWQEETWGGHYLFGKFDTVHLEKWSPKKLAQAFENRFDDHPFTEGAVLRVAEYSDGIWRNFKKGLARCLEELFIEGVDEPWDEVELISEEDVKVWIRDLVKEQIEYRLLDVFPRSKDRRNKAKKVLDHLRKKSARQKELTERFFGNKSQASRVLNELEAEGFLESEAKGMSKTWHYSD